MRFRLTEIFSLDDAFFDGLSYALSRFFLVSVVPGAIKESVTGLDGGVDGLTIRCQCHG